MKNKYWCLVLTNYENEDDVLYFHSFETAKENFLRLAKQHEDFDEFDINANENEKIFACTWFDPTYNEFSTYVKLKELEMPHVYSSVLF